MTCMYLCATRSHDTAGVVRNCQAYCFLTLYQMRGLKVNMTRHGSYTPTQMECLQLGSVGSVQSAVLTLSSLPVPYNTAGACTISLPLRR